MAWSIGIDFRATAGYVSDPAGCTYCAADVYPVTRGGATFGWDVAPIQYDQSTSIDHRLAGCASVSTPARTFRLDLPAPGDYILRAALGSYSFSSYYSFKFYDNATLLLAMTGTPISNNNQYRDMTQTLRTSDTDWAANNAPVTFTFASTILNVTHVASSAGKNIAHLYVEQVSTAQPWLAEFQQQQQIKNQMLRGAA